MQPDLCFATPRKLPKPKSLAGNVAVLDIAFAGVGVHGGFDKTTRRFIEALGDRLRIWVDHHDHVEHARFESDPRFVLASKAEHGACPEMITPELVARVGSIDTVVCHTDFDGLASAAKWMRAGLEPYDGCDADARAVDTRLGEPGPIGLEIDRALRARPRDAGLKGLVVHYLRDGARDPGMWQEIRSAAAELIPIERETRRAADGFRRLAPGVALVDIADGFGPVDTTLLLLLGQQRERVSVVLDRMNMHVAAAFDSGLNFLDLFNLQGGMPTRVSMARSQTRSALARLGVSSADIACNVP